MRHGGRAQCPLPITADAHDEPVDQDFLHRFSTKISVHEKTKICIRNQQVIEREALFHFIVYRESPGSAAGECLNCRVYTDKR